MKPRTCAAGAAVLALLGALLAVAPTASARAGAMRGAPEVRTCYNATFVGARRNEVPVRRVGCARPHTMIIFAVSRVPKSIKMVPINPTLQDYRFTTCSAAAAEQLTSNGIAWGRSAYNWNGYFPTKAQRERGARWVACGVVLEEDDRLVPLRTRGFPKVVENPPDHERSCLTAAYQFTHCAARHRYGPTVYDTVVPEVMQGKEAADTARAVCDEQAPQARAVTTRISNDLSGTYLGCLR